MQIIKKSMLTVDGSPSTNRTRYIGQTCATYLPTVDASNFFANELEVYIDRFVDPDTDELGLAYFVGEPPKNHFYRPYRVYKLKRPYTLADGTKRMTFSYYLPIPSRMLGDLGISRGHQQLVVVTAGYLRDGQKVVLIETKRGSQGRMV